MDLGQTDEVEVIPPSKPGRRRRFTAEEKRKMVEEASAPGQSISAVARRYGLSPSLLFRWRRLAEAGTMSSLDADEDVVPESEAKALRQQVRELQRLLGKKTQENEILQDALRLAREKKLLLRPPLPKKDDTR